MNQLSFSDAEYAGKRKKTRRELFLEEMEHVAPWKALLKDSTCAFDNVKDCLAQPLDFEIKCLGCPIKIFAIALTAPGNSCSKLGCAFCRSLASGWPSHV